MKKFIVLPVLLLLLLSSCEEITKVTVRDDNQDQVAHLGPDPDLLGNTELFFIPGTIQGSAIWVINGPAANIGVDIRDKDSSSFIYFADSYIGSGSNTAQTGTQIPWNKWMKVRVVVYKSGLSGIIVNIIRALGLDFFDSLEDYMIEQIFENEVYLSKDGTRLTTPVKSYYKLQELNL
ncbi:MAG TPA: hypothetical protein PLU05_04685 [Candidatus Cloacimonas acidaminovorans]|jgi:hypothetical protein|nr:hypothetical protein [Candidatus Cloacimonas sp.]HOE55589.1 hypothetical protein [Candidatus Cloacimonas acidaminovorans]HOM79241.1 hypothetical protein [Candidatus Cloacimonas acidaminovorans]HOS07166.1 hypothetical protein [Candidatus Cloacimonas acidaminovorans]HOT38273.1 hypothetical protein [Candidatus Cloacimonas acidaminovorans]